MDVAAWLRRTEWLWKIIGGFFLLAYLYWYLPLLRALPGSAIEPTEGRLSYARHWTLDFVATALAGGILLYLGFRSAAELTAEAPDADE